MSEELKELKMVEQILKDNITKLQAQEMNLKESIRQEGINRDNKIGLERADINDKIEEQKQRLAVMENNLKSEKIRLESIKIENNDRLVEIEKREQRSLDLEEKEKKFTEDRRNFENWRRSIIQDLEDAKIQMAEYDDISKRLKVKEDEISAREKSIVLKEKAYMDRIGELSVIEKEVQNKIDHLEALQKEPAHV